jgi:hypothetical protein
MQPLAVIEIGNATLRFFNNMIEMH